MDKKELIEKIIEQLGEKYNHSYNSHLRMAFKRMSISALQILQSLLGQLINSLDEKAFCRGYDYTITDIKFDKDKVKEEYITISEAGKLIGLTPARIYQLIKKHKLNTKYRRGIKVCLKSDIIKLKDPISRS